MPVLTDLRGRPGDLLIVLPGIDLKAGPSHNLGNTERQIGIWKDEIRRLRGKDRRTRFEMGKRLMAIQKERAKAKIGTFTTIDLKDLKISVWTAYRLIKFYRRIEVHRAADLLQSAKDQAKFPYEDVTEQEQRVADAEVDELDALMSAESDRIAKLQKSKNSQPKDYRILIVCRTYKQRKRLKAKWLSLDEQIRSNLVYQAVINA
jgi:hypothetical protein